MNYEVYSDVSYSARIDKMAYAAVVVCECVIVEQWTGTIPEENRSSVAEVMASAIACEKVPDGSILSVFTDVSTAILDALNRVLSHRRRFHIAVTNLREHLRRMKSWNVHRVNGSNKHYCWCHHEAWKLMYPERYATWQYWRAQKMAKPHPTRFSIGPVLAKAINDSRRLVEQSEL